MSDIPLSIDHLSTQQEERNRSVSFRPATRFDAPIIAKIDQLAYPLPGEKDMRWNEQYAFNAIYKTELKDTNRSFIAYDGSNPVGHMVMSLNDADSAQREIHVSSWSIIPAKRSIRTMRAMLEHMFEIGREHDVVLFEGWGRASTTFKGIFNEGMKKLLARYGYESVAIPRRPIMRGGELHPPFKLQRIQGGSK